jgi:hypothetical protein
MNLHRAHLHLPHLPPAAVLLSVVYAAAIAVALTDPGRNTLAGGVVLAGLTARWALRSRRRSRGPVPVTGVVADTADAVDAVDAVLTPDPALAPARTAAA